MPKVGTRDWADGGELDGMNVSVVGHLRKLARFRGNTGVIYGDRDVDNGFAQASRKSVSMRTEIDMDDGGMFQRPRACSFYGAAAALEDDGESEEEDNDEENGMYISEDRLRRDLEDDYQLFANRVPTGADYAKRASMRRQSVEVSSMDVEHGERNTGGGEHMNGQSGWNRLRNASLEKICLGSFRGDRVAQSSKVPLFVEEAGRKPRAAFLNGHLHRVSLCRSSVEMPRGAVGWGDGWLRFIAKRIRQWDAAFAVGRVGRSRVSGKKDRAEKIAAKESVRRERRLFQTVYRV